MLTFAVSPEKNRLLRVSMAQLGIREEDLEERFIRSSGAGGQHVNKNSTCVHITHRPSGIEVKCMRDRSQSVNRFLARREIVERLAAEAGLATPRSKEQDKIRKQKASRRRKVQRKQDNQTE